MNELKIKFVDKTINTLLAPVIRDKKIRKSKRKIYTNKLLKILSRPEIRSYTKNQRSRGQTNTVAYSAVTNGYDEVPPHNRLMHTCDYVLYTDGEKCNQLDQWTRRNLSIREDNNHNLSAKVYKILPHRFLPEYEFSIWIDGNINVAGEHLEKSFEDFKKSGKSIGIHKHPFRDCIYDEINECRRLGKEDPVKLMNWKNRLRDEGYPPKNGLYEMNLIFRRHNDKFCIDMMEQWWDIITKNSKRDQLSFMYVLWRSKVDLRNWIYTNETPIRKTKSFLFADHRNS